MSGIISLIPLPWRIAIIAGLLLAIGGAYGLGVMQGYGRGYEVADNKGKAALAHLQSKYDKAYADELERLQQRVREQTQTALTASATLTKERETNAEKETALLATIAAVTRNSKHTFSPEFVRLWNESTGADSADLPAARGAPGAVGTPGEGYAAGAGVLPAKRVTEADILAFMAYYGKRAKNLEAQVNGLITIIKGLQHESR